MRGIKTFTARLTCVLMAAGAVSAAVPEYFPLRTGNSWVYRVTQARATRQATINIGEIQTIGDRAYYKVQFFERDLLVRQDADGSLFAYDPELKSESLWLPLGADPGQAVRTSFDACARTATVASRNAKLTTDIGSFDNALELRYTSTCADAGVSVQHFLPYVGLVRQEATSIAGPVVYEMTYSRTGVTNIDTKTNAFTLALDAPVYQRGQEREASARLTLRSSEQINLTFPSGQSTDMRITSEKGDSVYVWSADKLFTMIYREREPVGPGEKSWVMNFPISQLPAGKYSAEAWLTTSPRLYSATVTFEVK